MEPQADVRYTFLRRYQQTTEKPHIAIIDRRLFTIPHDLGTQNMEERVVGTDSH